MRTTVNLDFSECSFSEFPKGDIMSDGASATNCTAQSSWRELYEAALFETDKSKLAERIADAEQALVARARQLFDTNADDVERDQTLDDALNALLQLLSARVRRRVTEVSGIPRDQALFP